MRVIQCLRLFPKAGMFGVEIEAEGAGLDIPENKFWRQEADGSLRAKPECCEYVFKEPLSYEDSITAVGWLNAQHKKNGTVLNWSFRCSTHVHLNVQEMELSALLRLVYLYYIFENLLVKWSGEEREGNRFCLRLKDSSEIPFVVENIFRNSLRGVNENQVRYSALNLGSLIKYGSVEFRSLSGTTDRERLSKWLNGITNLRDYAIQAKSLQELFEKAKGNLNAFGKEVFGEFFSELRYMNWEFDALYNMSLCINFIPLYEEVLENEKDFDRRLQEREQQRKADEERLAEMLNANKERVAVKARLGGQIDFPELGQFRHEPENEWVELNNVEPD